MSGVDNSCTTYAAASIKGLNKEPAAASNPLCHVSPRHSPPDQIPSCEYDLTNNHQGPNVPESFPSTRIGTIY